MIVLFSGTRCANDAENSDDFKEVLSTIMRTLEEYKNLKEPLQFVVGDARGVDSIVRKIARKYNVDMKVFNANWNTHGRAAGHIRNKTMINFCINQSFRTGEKALFIAFPAENKPSPGTENAINTVRRASNTFETATVHPLFV